MTSSIDSTKPVASSALVSAEIRNNFTAAKNDIEDLQGAQLLSGSGTGMVFSRRGKVRFPTAVGDGVTDCATLTTNYWTSLQGTGKVLQYDAGEYINSAIYPNLAGFYIEALGNDTVLTSTRRLGGVVNIVGDCGVEGGIWGNRFGRQYDITAMSVTSNVCTATIPGHPYIIGDVLTIRCTAGINANGTRTVTSVTGNNITFALTTADATATIPYSRNDLYNTGSRAIYPFAQMPRATTDEHVFQHTGGGTYHLRNLMMRGSRAGGLISYSGRAFLEDLQVRECASDGLHFTGGTQDVTCTGVIHVRRVEEANMAYIGYRKSTMPIARITIQTLDVGDQLFHGSGIDLNGVVNFSCERFIATNIYGSGIRMMGEGSPYWTFGNRNVHIGHATLNACGCYGTVVPAGWENDNLASILFEGGGLSEPERRTFGSIDLLEIFNSRWRPFADAGPTTINVGTLEVYGGYIGATSLSELRDWKVGSASFEETPEAALSLGDATAAGVNRWGPIKFININVGVPIGLASASCDGTTVTYVCDSAHGMSGTPIFQMAGIESSYVGVGADPGQDAYTHQAPDFALNGNWMPMPANWVASTNYSIHDRRIASASYISGTPAAANFYFEVIYDGGSAGSAEPAWTLTDGAFTTDGSLVWVARAMSGVNTYTGISFPDTVTIAITGSGKAATTSPRIYSTAARIPKARLFKGGTSSNDAVQIDSGSAGVAQGTFVIEDVQLFRQWFLIDRLVFSGTSGALRLFGARDWTYQTGTLSGVLIEGGVIPGQNRYVSSYVGLPFAAAITGNTIYATRIWIDRPEVAINRLGFEMTTAETGADARLSLYSPDGELLISGEYVDAFSGAAGVREIVCYHRIWRAGWYQLTINTNRASTGAIKWHYIDTTMENRLRSSALASSSDLGWTAVEVVAQIAAAADFATLKTNLAARTPAPDFLRTQSQTYGAAPATLTLVRSNSASEPHLWARFV